MSDEPRSCNYRGHTLRVIERTECNTLDVTEAPFFRRGGKQPGLH